MKNINITLLMNESDICQMPACPWTGERTTPLHYQCH